MLWLAANVGVRARISVSAFSLQYYHENEENNCAALSTIGRNGVAFAAAPSSHWQTLVRVFPGCLQGLVLK